MKKVIALFSAIVICSSAAVFARSSYEKVFVSTYKLAKTSPLVKAKCVTCHVKKGKKDLNLYGKDLKKAMKGSKKLTATMLKSIEKLDSDKDKVKNIDEIKKGTNPGDPKKK